MRGAFWPALTLVLAGVSFVAGRIADSFRAPPAIVATLPGDEAGFSHELDERIRERFPIGTSEGKLIDYLASEQFVPAWRRRDSANASSLVENGLICKKTVRVLWRADAAGILTEVSGAYESHCL